MSRTELKHIFQGGPFRFLNMGYLPCNAGKLRCQLGGVIVFGQRVQARDIEGDAVYLGVANNVHQLLLLFAPELA